MKTISVRTRLKVADEVWIATVLLHREHPEDPDFTVDQIVQRAKQEGISRPFRPGVYVHAVQHCVANRPPNPGRYRMLFESAPGRRRLFRKGDSYHPEREGGKIIPEREDMPHRYEGLIAWYENWSSAMAALWRPKLKKRIRCFRCAARAKSFGPTNMPMNTCAVFARDGNEPGILGH